MRSLLAVLPILLLVSCDRTPNTPEGVADACLKHLAAGKVETAAKLFADGERQQKWFERYYGEQPIEELFNGPVGNVFVSGEEAVVTYTPKKTLFNAFGKHDLVLLKKQEGDWKVDIETAGRLKSAINGGGVKTNLSIVGTCIKEASEKLGRTPKTVQEIIDNLEVAGAKSSVRSYTRMFDYHPDGKSIDGVDGVIFYTKEPYRHGMHLGATKEKLFLSGDGKVIIETTLSLF